MKKITFLLLIAMSLFVFNSCDEEGALETKDLNYISFQTGNLFPVDIDGVSEHIINVYATNMSSSERTYLISVDIDLSTADPTYYTVPETVTIPANSNVGELAVSIADVNIGVAGKVLVLKFDPATGLNTGADIQLSVIQSCPGNEVYFDITFDDWGSETSWDLKDSSNNLVASGSGYKDGASGYSTSFCLGVGTYTYTVNDAYGDGGATTTITKNNVTLVNILGSDYATSASATFDIN